jgi:nitrogen-specific signal transduction histidine kinase
MISETSTAHGRPTLFLPAERAAHAEILRQHESLSSDPLVHGLIDSSIGLTMVLNEQRQIVLINETLRIRLGLTAAADAVGARLGDALGCLRATQPPNGCGTTEACRDCGAAQAIAGALSGRVSVQTCRIRTVVCGQDLSLQLRATPFAYKDEDFVMVSASDVEPEMRRQQLERIFFHDVLNTASGVQGLLHVMQEADEDDAVQKYIPLASKASDTLIDELLCQRDMVAAESGELAVTRMALEPHDFLTGLVGMLASHPLAKKRRIALTPDSGGFRLTTDKTLLSRVLVNLIKNALEAVPQGETVTVSCRREGGLAVFLVHNPTFMPPEVQHQVFQRSFSTKGAGRGVGTYSIRLLTENYLGGKVSFTSDHDRGTMFRAAYPLGPAA